jgi:hypothetical protein
VPSKPAKPSKLPKEVPLGESHDRLSKAEAKRRIAEKAALQAKIDAEKHLQRSLPLELRTSCLSYGNEDGTESTGHEVIGKTEVHYVTTHYQDGSTSKRYGNDAFQLIRDRNGKWSLQYDYGKVSIHNKISQGIGYMSHEEYAQLRYAMSLLEGAKRGHMESEAALAKFVSGGVSNSTVNQKATRMLDLVMKRDLENECENEWIMLSIAVLANKLDRPPTKVEARKFYISYGGFTYRTSAAFRQQLEAIGATWLPAGVRGKARSKQ